MAVNSTRAGLPALKTLFRGGASSVGEPCTAFGTAAGEYLAAVCRGHSLAESMLL